MLLLWALSSTLSISVYNVEGRKDPVIPESSEADVRARQTGADGASSCFGKSPQGCLLAFEHSWRTKSPHVEVTIYVVMNLDCAMTVRMGRGFF